MDHTPDHTRSHGSLHTTNESHTPDHTRSRGSYGSQSTITKDHYIQLMNHTHQITPDHTDHTDHKAPIRRGAGNVICTRNVIAGSPHTHQITPDLADHTDHKVQLRRNARNVTSPRSKSPPAEKCLFCSRFLFTQILSVFF